MATKRRKRNTIKKTRRTTVASSYSPEMNKLVSYRAKPIQRHEVFAGIVQCLRKRALKNRSERFHLRTWAKKPYLLVNNTCLPFDSIQAQNYVKDNLTLNKEIHPDKIVGPKQLVANCWFNCGFMMNFVSDKGRKFTRYLRYYMITGKLDEWTVPSYEMRKVFFLLNLCIEACLMGDPLAWKMNTNDIIRKIHENIVSEKVLQSVGLIPKVGEAGNPIEYYRQIINSLSSPKRRINALNFLINRDNEISSFISLKNHLHTRIDVPEVITVMFREDRDNNDVWPNVFEVGNVQYILDSALIIDDDREHFCCFITVNGADYGFEGISHSTVQRKEWKQYINNKDRNLSLITDAVFNFKTTPFFYLNYFRNY